MYLFYANVFYHLKTGVATNSQVQAGSDSMQIQNMSAKLRILEQDNSELKKNTDAAILDADADRASANAKYDRLAIQMQKMQELMTMQMNLMQQQVQEPSRGRSRQRTDQNAPAPAVEYCIHNDQSDLEAEDSDASSRVQRRNL